LFSRVRSLIEMMSRSEHLTKVGLDRIITIRNGMNRKRSTQERLGFYETRFIRVSVDWLIGFIDVEGNFRFQVTPNVTSKLGFRVA